LEILQKEHLERVILYHQFLAFFENEGISPEEVIKMYIDSLDCVERMLKRGANLKIGRIATQSFQWDDDEPRPAERESDAKTINFRKCSSSKGHLFPWHHCQWDDGFHIWTGAGRP
jgi:hypothetical protein